MSEFISLLTAAHSKYFILEPSKNAGLETNWRSTLVVLSLEHALIQLKQCLAGDLRQGQNIALSFFTDHFPSFAHNLTLSHSLNQSRICKISTQSRTIQSTVWRIQVPIYAHFFLCITFIHYIKQCVNTEDQVQQMLKRLNIPYYCVYMSIFYSSIGMCAFEYTCMYIIQHLYQSLQKNGAILFVLTTGQKLKPAKLM